MIKLNRAMNKIEPVIVVHGGAGAISDDTVAKKLIEGVKIATKEGYKVLSSTGSVLDAVEAAVRILEDDEHFNAGKGSVLNMAGEVEMDASIMLGSNLSAGAVTVVKNVKNPISLARKVMEETPHVLLAGDGALKLAEKYNCEILQPGALVTEKATVALEQVRMKLMQCAPELGTVGAVAVDSMGRVAVATSTGGYLGKMVGRCSDTCMIGAGSYAVDDFGAVSTTGHGETIAKFCLAHSIVFEMKLGKSAQAATTDSIKNMTQKLKNTAGAIAISTKGDVGIGFSTNRMSWAYQKGKVIHFGIDHNQHEQECE